MKGLMVEILKSGLGDCTNCGVTANTDHAILKVDGCEVFESKLGRPALVLIETDPVGVSAGRRNIRKDGTVVRVRAVPADDEGNPRIGGMFGGNFITASDSRFPFDNPIPVHDRFE